MLLGRIARIARRKGRANHARYSLSDRLPLNSTLSYTFFGLLALTTVLGCMLLHPRYGHSYPVEQLLFLKLGQAPQPRESAKPVALFQELRFQPFMLWTAYRKGQKKRHKAPVENAERQVTMWAKKKQTLFSPYIRPARLQGLVSSANPSLSRLLSGRGPTRPSKPEDEERGEDDRGNFR